jgi:hypothetical protein
LFPDRLLVSLAPSGIAWLRFARWPRTRLLGAAAIACDPGFGAAPWYGALDALRTAMDALAREPLRASVVLSNHLVRYALVPAQDELSGAEEELAYARHVFARTFGGRAKDWDIRLDEAPRGATRVASAIDRELLQELRACFPRGGKARLVSVQPFLMPVFNRARRRPQGGLARLVLAEPGRACLARFAKGRWEALQNVRAGADSPADCAALLERDRHLAGDDGVGTVYAYVACASPIDAPGWRIEPLAPPAGIPASADARYALALASL